MAGTQNQPLEYEQLSYNSPGGAQFGRSTTEFIAFYGSTPIVQPTSSSLALVSTVSSQSTSSGTGVGWAFASQAEFQNAVTTISNVAFAMRQLGLMA